MLLYFTSGTTSRPKLVEHTQVSYPVGHLPTMYFLGVQPVTAVLDAVDARAWAGQQMADPRQADLGHRTERACNSSACPR